LVLQVVVKEHNVPELFLVPEAGFCAKRDNQSLKFPSMTAHWTSKAIGYFL